MRARRTRAVGKVASEFSGGTKSSEKARRQRFQQPLPSLRLVRSPAPRGPSKSRHPTGNLASSIPRRPEISTWFEAPLSAIVSHILSRHHPFTYRHLHRLERLLAQVVDQHARDRPRLIELQVLFLILSDKLATHMIREEQMLFPYILRLEKAAERGERFARPVFGSVRDPIDVLMVEHEGMKAALEKIQAIWSSFPVPPEESASWKALDRALKTLERDLRRHLQIEDTILFPRAVGAENSDRYLIGV